MIPCAPSTRGSTPPWSATPTSPFFGGVVGYAAYDLVRYYERLPSLKPDDLGLPDLLFVEPEVVAVFDHLKNLLHLVAPGRDPEEAEARLFWAERRLKGPLPGVPGERAGGGPASRRTFPGRPTWRR